jgi:hypothetical protein
MTTKPEQINVYFDAFGKGHARKDAARIAGVSVRTAQTLERRYWHDGEPLPKLVADLEQERCCDEPGCRRQHPILLRREGGRWYAVTKYVYRFDGSLSVSERHDITEQMRELVRT